MDVGLSKDHLSLSTCFFFFFLGLVIEILGRFLALGRGYIRAHLRGAYLNWHQFELLGASDVLCYLIETTIDESMQRLLYCIERVPSMKSAVLI